MLIRFSVENFRSFKDRQSLYLNAVKTCKEWNDANTAEESGVRVVRSAVVYGANASGKTNLFIAMERMRAFMLASIDIDKIHNSLLCEPFLLTSKTLLSPETFEIEFTLGEQHYIYGFSILTDATSMVKYRVVKEWLAEVRNKRTVSLFIREKNTKANAEEDVISVDAKYMPQGCGLESRTRNDALFLTVAAQFAEPCCQRISEYLRYSLVIFSGINHGTASNFSRNTFAIDAYMSEQIKKLICAADVGIKNIMIGANGQIVSQHTPYDANGNPMDGMINFSFDLMESLGTQKLFDLSGVVIDALRNGRIMVVDELDAKLHPIIVRHLIELFNNSKTNPKNAQLIFNAQSPDLLGYKAYSEAKGKKIARLRRDQIYFVEKDNQEASKVFSLIEFKKDSGLRTRNDASYDKDYLSGVYGGIPFPKEMVSEVPDNG